ncbi:MAG: hypothetical protein ABWX84_03175 [Nocardioides sp.]
MRGTVAVALGAVLFFVGLVFTLQGLGYIQGSAMTGVDFWAFAGPVVAGLGVALVIVGLRRSGPRRPR